jgi:hypothetical protein
MFNLFYHVNGVSSGIHCTFRLWLHRLAGQKDISQLLVDDWSVPDHYCRLDKIWVYSQRVISALRHGLWQESKPWIPSEIANVPFMVKAGAEGPAFLDVVVFSNPIRPNGAYGGTRGPNEPLVLTICRCGWKKGEKGWQSEKEKINFTK